MTMLDFVLDASVTVAWCFVLALPIAVEPVARGRAFGAVYRLARTHALTPYDAACLEIALRRGVPLATIDGPLRAAADADAEGVGVFDRAD